MFTKKFKKELLITPLAAAGVVEETIPEETDTEALKEIINFAYHLAAGWDRVRTLVERRLEVIEAAERIVQSRGKEASQKVLKHPSRLSRSGEES